MVCWFEKAGLYFLSFLNRLGISPDRQLLLSDHGVKKRKRQDYDTEQAALVLQQARAMAEELQRLFL